MKKSSITKKVSTLTVRVSLISVALIGLIAMAGLLILRANTVEISTELGDTAASDSQKALETQMTDRLLVFAANKAALSDATLQAIQNSVEMIAESAEEIAQNPGRYNAHPVAAPNAANKDIMTAQFLRAEGVNPDEILENAALMGNIQGLLLNIIHNNIDAATNYIGTERGYIIIVDDVSDRKTEFFDPRERPWYQLAVANDSVSWTDLYVDAYGRGLAITCAKPYYGSGGQLEGVAGVGTILTELVEIVTGATIGETGYAFMLNELGQVIISDDLNQDSDGNIIREDLLNSDNQAMAAVARNMTAGQNGIERVDIDGKEFFIAYAALNTLPWSLATVVEVGEVIAPAVASGQNIIKMKDDAIANINIVIYVVIFVFIFIIAASVLVIGYVSRRFAGTLTKPITVLQDGVGQISGGNLEHIINIHTGDEIEDLGQSVNKMAVDLREYIDNLQAVTAEKERIGAELDVATKIQASMLPCIFPAFPNRAEFDIYASMEPAKEVGGDFYDFFLIDENTLAVVMADVSGKGVPAALFMVIAKTLIKNNAQYGKTPKGVFETVNNLLCEGNEADMFVTAILGYLDIPTGRFIFVNAGHNPPLIRTGGGEFEWLHTKPGFVLAGMEDMFYKQHEVMLGPGDELFLYTDGVTEAVNNEDELFTDPKLLEVANQYLDLPLKEFTVSIKREIDKFAEGAEQADDITMLIIRISGGANEGTDT